MKKRDKYEVYRIRYIKSQANRAAILVFPLMLAKMFTNSSGVEVPDATKEHNPEAITIQGD